MISKDKSQSLQKACEVLVNEPKLRYIGIINKMGRTIAEVYQRGIVSLLQDKEDKMISMELALEIFLREEFDDKLGPIEYVLSKRKKVNLISIPIANHLVLISTEPKAKIDEIVQKTREMISKILQEN